MLKVNGNDRNMIAVGGSLTSFRIRNGGRSVARKIPVQKESKLKCETFVGNQRLIRPDYQVT